MAEPTFTIFSDAKIPGWAEGFAELLREGSTGRVDIVDSLDEALDGEADALILNLGRRDDEKLSAERIASLGRAQDHRLWHLVPTGCARNSTRSSSVAAT